tara:strand:+ start:771 stop:1361 length:591 start_codon:yes stop_codon:yes gene_type:complete
MTSIIYRDSILKTILIYNIENKHTNLINKLFEIIQNQHYISKFRNISFIKEKQNIRKIIKIPYIIKDSILNLDKLPLDILNEINSYLSFSIKYKNLEINKCYNINNYINSNYFTNDYIIYNQIKNDIKLDYTYEFYYLKDGYYYPTNVRFLYAIQNTSYSNTFVFFKNLLILFAYILFTLFLISKRFLATIFNFTF